MTRTSLWFHTGDVRPGRKLTAVLVACCLMVGLLVAPGGAFAQTTTQAPTTQTPAAQTPPTTPSPAPPSPVSMVIQVTPPPEPLVGEPAVQVRDGAIQLSLEQAVAVVLRQNLALASQLYVREQERLSVLQNLGIYDLRSDAVLAFTNSEQEPFDPRDPIRRESQSFDFGFSQLFPWGGDFSIGLDQSRNSLAFNPGQSVADVPTIYGGGLDFGYRQPLLRGFGRIATENGLLIAQLDDRISREEFERQVTLTIQQVVDAYWTLVGAREQLGVAEQSMALAREFHERNRIQVEVGTLAPLELVQSEAAIAERDEDIISAQSAFGDAADELRRLLNLPPGELWELPINATTPPQTDERLAINVEEAIRTAFEERPELQRQQLQLEQSQITSAFFRNQKRPRLDLNVGYGSSATNDVFRDIYSDLFGLDLVGWSTTLTFAYPIQNRAARAQSASADLGVDLARTALEDQQDTIRTEVRQAARRVDTAAKQIDAARASVRFQERNLEAERKRYENGMSTSFEITQIQEDLTLARSREVNATINYRTALTEYYRATGTLLEQQGVELVDPEQPIRRFTLF